MEQEFYSEDNYTPQSPIQDENANTLRMQRMQKFQSMGIPVPQAPQVAISTVHTIKDPRMLEIFNAVKSGAKRKEFSKIVHQGEKPLPASQHLNRQQQAKQQAQLQNQAGRNGNQPESTRPANKVELFQEAPVFNTDLAEAERILNGDFDTPRRPGNPANPNQLPPVDRQALTYENINDVDNGARFTNEFKNKFHSTLQEKQRNVQYQQPAVNPQYGYTPQYQPQPQNTQYLNSPVIQSGMIIISEEDLKKKIINYSSQICKKIVEQVINTEIAQVKKLLTEFVKQQGGKGTITETATIKKAEIVGNNAIKMNGKIYKLTEVKE